MSVKSIMIVGVGGQGTLLTSRLLGSALLAGGYDVKVSEVHGMSQRGGSVVTYVKYGDKVNSPIVVKGEADLILAFEQLEAARWLPYLKKGGKIIVNTQQMDPMPVVTGMTTYPENILDSVRALGADITAVDALSMAVEAGSPKAVNVVLVGVMAKHVDFPVSVWHNAIKETVPEKFLELIQMDSYTAHITHADGTEEEADWEASNLYAKGEAKLPESVTIIGGKTGTTDKAGNCLILLSEDEAGNRYVSVVMGADSKDHLYTDMTTLLEGGVAAAGQSSENTE